MPKEISLIFPGQGSQKLGMLTPDLLHNYQDIVNKSSDLLDINFITLINEDSNNLLNQSSFTQPALLLISYLHFLNFKNITNLNPILMSGHSLGEYSALVASNAIDFFDTLELVRRRGTLMESASKGSMAAIMGLEKSILEGLCANEQNLNNSTVSCANLNSPIQIVIAGTEDAVTNVCNSAKEAGAKRAILLNVSVASHCMLMQKPAEEFNNYLNKISISMPNTNILQNFSGEVSNSENMIKENLINQLTGSVKWMDVMKKVKATNSIVIECGPGKVLQGIGRSNGLSDILNTSAENFNTRLEELL